MTFKVISNLLASGKDLKTNAPINWPIVLLGHIGEEGVLGVEEVRVLQNIGDCQSIVAALVVASR